VQPTPVVNWDNHALRLSAHQLCKHAWNYFTQTHSTLILGVCPLDQIAHVEQVP